MEFNIVLILWDSAVSLDPTEHSIEPAIYSVNYNTEIAYKSSQMLSGQ